MSNQFELLQEACQLNNSGASFLASGNAGSAVKALKSALVIMESISRDDAREDPIKSHLASDATQATVEIPGLDDPFFIYNRALLLDTTSIQEMDLAFSNAVVLFNLSLTFHQRGKTCCQEAKLQHALRFYELSANLVSNSSSNCSAALVMAALNNQAQICYNLCHYNVATHVLNQVRELAQEVSAPQDTSSPFSQEVLDQIYLNVLTISHPPTTASSA